MASRPAGHRGSRSFHVTVMPIAPSFGPAADSNRKTDFSPRVRYCKRVNSASTIQRKDAGFESQEPTSPKIGCMGQIKLKPQWAKPASKKADADKAVKDNSKLSRLKKLMGGKHHKNGKAEEEKGEEGKKGYPSLGQLKPYTSSSYDDKFGTMFVEEGPIVANSGSIDSTGVPKEESGINIWKRRSIPPLTELDVDKTTGERFEPRKPLTR